MSWGDAGNFNNETDATGPEDRSIRITCLPAQHGAARTPFDVNKTLWCGWLLEFRGRKIAFLGDSGYAPFFAELGRRFGPLDLAFIPIGAYEPRWFMHPLHMNPEEAVLVHRELRSKRSIAMHWGTFALADDPLAEAPRLLKAARSAAGLTQDEFSLLRLGETILV
jgi:N-acyl-phosphatidylethanolamine-hydrolysing phospholipase D